MTELEMLNELKKYDTPSITNVVATYPHDKRVCLGLYNPWETNWYTDQNLKCIYPELGRTVGIAVTCIVGIPSSDPACACVTYNDVLHSIADCDLPAIVCVKQDLPDHLKNKSGFSGGLLTAQWKQLGAVGCISDGPSRDIDEIRPMQFQYMLTGVCAGHGLYQMKAVDVPVNICGMDVAPGEVIHMDESGAVKFPRKYLPQVLENVRKLYSIEAHRFELFKETNDPDRLSAIADGQEDEE